MGKLTKQLCVYGYMCSVAVYSVWECFEMVCWLQFMFPVPFQAEDEADPAPPVEPDNTHLMELAEGPSGMRDSDLRSMKDQLLIETSELLGVCVWIHVALTFFPVSSLNTHTSTTCSSTVTVSSTFIIGLSAPPMYRRNTHTWPTLRCTCLNCVVVCTCNLLEYLTSSLPPLPPFRYPYSLLKHYSDIMVGQTQSIALLSAHLLPFSPIHPTLSLSPQGGLRNNYWRHGWRIPQIHARKQVSSYPAT